MTNVQTTPEVAQQSPAAPADPTGEQPRTWYFTFGAGQRYDGRYVTIAGTYDEARAEMFRHFGNAWSFQYSSTERAGIQESGLRLLAHRDWPTDRPTTTPAEVVSAAAAGQPALTRIARANMLRAITRMSYAVDREALPVPAGVRFDAKRHAVVLEFDAVGQAEAWAAELAAGDPDRDDLATPDGRQWSYFNAHAEWRGFHVSLVALVPAGAEQTSAVPA